MKKISYLFIVLAILLSDIMCAVVAYNYCALQWGGQCIILARFFYKKQENKE